MNIPQDLINEIEKFVFEPYDIEIYYKLYGRSCQTIYHHMKDKIEMQEISIYNVIHEITFLDKNFKITFISPRRCGGPYFVDITGTDLITNESVYKEMRYDEIQEIFYYDNLLKVNKLESKYNF